MKDIESFSYDDLISALHKSDKRGLYEKKAVVPDSGNLPEVLKQETGFADFTRRTVLGIDIYQYSQYHSFEQTLVPFLFKLIYKEVCRICLEKAGFLFQKYKDKNFRKQFIDTGDGGFQIFETPLHASVFAIHFELIVRYYNAYQFYPKLRELIGALELRYAMTHDHIFEFDGNHYGPCIINNNRILSKDELNRFLIDENTFNWFMMNMSGVENLQILSLEEIKKIKDFEDYLIDDRPNADSIFPRTFTLGERGNIVSAFVQKIGKINVKSTALSIYNLHLQYLGGLSKNEDPGQKTVITVSLGNLNTSGIT